MYQPTTKQLKQTAFYLAMAALYIFAVDPIIDSDGFVGMLPVLFLYLTAYYIGFKGIDG